MLGKAILSISIDNRELKVESPPHSTNWYRSFMDYCIDNYGEQIMANSKLGEYFKTSPTDPGFKAAVKNNKVHGHNPLYFHDYLNTKAKKDRIEKIAKDLNLDYYLREEGE
jgi:cytolysin (calcineurin-like family phosphatase)